MAIFNYSVLRFIPDPSRGERLNIGVVVFRDGDLPDVRLAPGLHKLRAVDPNINPQSLYAANERLASMSNGKRPDGHAWINLINMFMAPMRADKESGQFVAANTEEYDVRVNALLASLVMPPPAKYPKRSGDSRLFTALRNEISAMGILGADDEDLYRHRVVPHYPIVEGAINADFALRNGAMHIVETLDMRVKQESLRNKSHEASTKAIAFDQAKSTFGPATQTFAVIAAKDYQDAVPAENVLSRYAGHVLHRDSAEDMQFLRRHLLQAAGRPMLEESARH